jgi:hypothetical protein
MRDLLPRLSVLIVGLPFVAPVARAQAPLIEPTRSGGLNWTLLSWALLAVVVVAAIVVVRRRGAHDRPRSVAPPPPRDAPAAPPRDERRSVFISYRRGDSADITGRIYDRLVQHFGRACVYKDVDSIPLGIDFREHLEQAVGRCHVLLAIVGRGWLDAGGEAGARRLDDSADFLRIEVETALKRNVPVIPVLVQGATMPPEQALPPSLRGFAYRNGVAVRADPDFHGDVDRLIAGIEAHFRAV